MDSSVDNNDAVKRAYIYDRRLKGLIADYVVSIAIKDIDPEHLRTIMMSVKTLQRFYVSRFDKYLELQADLTREKYIPCRFWFNDAGLQYM